MGNGMVRTAYSGHASVGLAAIVGSIVALSDVAALAQSEPFKAGTAFAIPAPAVSSMVGSLRQLTDRQDDGTADPVTVADANDRVRQTVGGQVLAETSIWQAGQACVVLQ